MGQRLSRRTFLLAASPAALAAPAPAPNTLTAEERAAGFELLFDGKTMRGWEDPSKETPPGDAWVVDSGCLKAVSRPRIREDLVSRESFSDFELLFEWRISPGGNSGVKYRIQDRVVLERGKPSPAGRKFEDMVNYELTHRLADRARIAPDAEIEEYLIAFEYQVIDPRVAADPEAGPGALYELAGSRHQAAKPVGEFNQGRIVLEGNRVRHWLNGTLVVDVRLDAPEVLARLARRWGAGSPVHELLSRQPKRATPIALQHHNDEAWFRSIKIRRL
jgi:hypothetical protein